MDRLNGSRYLSSASMCVLIMSFLVGSAEAQISSTTPRFTLPDRTLPTTTVPLSLRQAISDIESFSADSQVSIARWASSTDWARQWVSESPFSVEYQESASYSSGVVAGSRTRKERKPRSEDELRAYYHRVYPDLRDDQIDHVARLYAQVDARVVEWRKVVRNLDIPDKIAVEFANAGDDVRMAQLYQEVILAKAGPALADVIIPIFEKAFSDGIDNFKVASQ